jgi:hypothetical protein
MATKKSKTPMRGDRHAVPWSSTPWGGLPRPVTDNERPKFATVNGPVDFPPTKAARKAAVRLAKHRYGTAKGIQPRRTPRAQRAALVARRAAYREALRDWAMGVSIDNADALASIGLRVAHERPKEGRSDAGGMDKGLEAMERATGREMPAHGPFMDAVIAAYHDGLPVWTARKVRQEAEWKRSPDAVLEDREGRRKGRMKATFHPLAPPMRRRLHLFVYEWAERLVRAAFTAPKALASWEYFQLSVNETWHEKVPVQPKRYPMFAHTGSRRGRSARADIAIDTNVLPLWTAGLAHHYGPHTLITGISRENPSTCFVVTQRGPLSFTCLKKPTPSVS